MDQYTIYLSEEQTKKAIELGAEILVAPEEFYVTLPHFNMNICGENASVILPTAEQMIGWLEEQGFHFDFEFITMTCCMVQYNHEYINNPICGTRKEATLAGIDAALEYLTNQKNK